VRALASAQASSIASAGGSANRARACGVSSHAAEVAACRARTSSPVTSASVISEGSQILPDRSISTYRPRRLSRSASSECALRMLRVCATCAAGMAASLDARPGSSNVSAAIRSPPICLSWCHSSIRPTGARIRTLLGSSASAIRQPALPHSSTASAATEYARAARPDTANVSASSSSPCVLRAAATPHAISSFLPAALMARRSIVPA